MLLINTDENVTLKTKNETITYNSNQKLLGMLLYLIINLISMNISVHFGGNPSRSYMLLQESHIIWT